jgi:phospholipid/cholesterol/gamma-HCH transport system substrate-binding protein
MTVLKGAAPIIKKQLIAFTIAAVVGAVILAMSFLKVPEMLGMGRHTVNADFAQGAGLYKGAEVTYLGAPVGKVKGMHLAGDKLVVEMSLVNSVDVPASVSAEIHSRSAVGEQYVSLVPDAPAAGPDLRDGDQIPMSRTSYPVEIGPVLDHVQSLVASLDEKKLSSFIDETGAAFAGRTGDLQKILDGGNHLIDAADANFRPTAALLRDLEPVLGTVNGHSSNIARLTRNLDQVTTELRAGDADLRRLLANGPRFTATTLTFLDDLGERLPALISRTNPVLGLLVTYNRHLAQLLSDLPLAAAAVQSATLTELGSHEVRLTLANANKPPECTEGFLPPSQWASPLDLTPRKTPLLYCKAPRSDPRGVRGARNIPCATDPTRREGDARKC